MSSSSFLTLKLSDERYASYLNGSFSKTERALPIRSSGVGTNLEETSFEIRSRESIKRPNVISLWLKTLRLHHMSFVLFPLLIAISGAAQAGSSFDGRLLLFLALSVTCFQIAGNLLNDYYDHMTGVDRLHPFSGSRSIQKGWLSAIDLWRGANLFLGVGSSIGLMVLLEKPMLLWIFALFGALAFFSFYGGRKALRYRGGSEWLVLFLLGPFLAAAFRFALDGQVDIMTFAQGFCFGWWMLFYTHLKNFEHLVVLSQLNIKNWITRSGFESSKRLLGLWLLAFFGLYTAVYFSSAQFFILGLALSGGLPLAFPFLKTLRGLNSSLGSGLIKLRKQGLSLFWMFLGSWALGLLLSVVSWG